MPSNKQLLNSLASDYPQLIFRHGKKFAFHPPDTIVLGPPHDNFALLTLHELAHATLKHKDFNLDVERLKIETSAWQQTKKLCHKYHIAWDEEFAEDNLDTYRDWLHKKSLCPTCNLSRYQDPSGTYHCPFCR